MEVTLAGGAVVDIASREDVAEHHRRLEQLLEGKKSKARLERLRTGKAATATPVVLDLGRPPMGLVWLPQYATAWGNDAFTSVSNVAWVLFAGPLPSGNPALAVGPPVAGLDQGDPILTGGNSGISVPSTQSVPDQVVVYPQDNLYAVFAGSGLVAGANSYKILVGVIVLPDTELADYLV